MRTVAHGLFMPQLFHELATGRGCCIFLQLLPFDFALSGALGILMLCLFLGYNGLLSRLCFLLLFFFSVSLLVRLNLGGSSGCCPGCIGF